VIYFDITNKQSSRGSLVDSTSAAVQAENHWICAGMIDLQLAILTANQSRHHSSNIFRWNVGTCVEAANGNINVKSSAYFTKIVYW